MTIATLFVKEEAQLRKRVLSRYPQKWQHFTDLAEQPDEIPRDVNRTCRHLALESHLLLEGSDEFECQFKLAK
jgi:hypothetical protein